MKKILLILAILLILINLFSDIVKLEDMKQFEQNSKKIRSMHIGINFARFPSFGLSMNYNNIYCGIFSRDDINKLKGSDFTEHPNWHNYGNWRETNRASSEMAFEFGYYSSKYEGVSIFPYIGIIHREYCSEYYNGNTYHYTYSKNNKSSNDLMYGCGINYKGFLIKVAKEPGYIDIGGNKKDNIGIQLGATLNLPESNKQSKLMEKPIKFIKKSFSYTNKQFSKISTRGKIITCAGSFVATAIILTLSSAN